MRSKLLSLNSELHESLVERLNSSKRSIYCYTIKHCDNLVVRSHQRCFIPLIE